MTAPCQCGKIRFLSRRHARQAARGFRNHGTPMMRAYRCPGGFWHLTSQGAAETAWWRARTSRGS